VYKIIEVNVTKSTFPCYNWARELGYKITGEGLLTYHIFTVYQLYKSKITA